MSENTHVLELLPAYALGSLDTDEADQVRQHLLVCSTCNVELRAYQDTADQLAFASPDNTPPPDLKHRLMERVEPGPAKTPQQSQSVWRRSVQRLMPVWAPISLLLILTLSAANLLLLGRVSRQENVTPTGEMMAIPLVGTEFAPRATGVVIVSHDGLNGALVVDELPPLDTEQQYQLWLIRDGQRSSGALLSVDEDGYGGTRIVAPESLFEYTAVGLTIEPAGGSQGPTGHKVLGGSLFDR